MRFEPRRAFFPSSPIRKERFRTDVRRDMDLPSDVAFLRRFFVPRSVLEMAAARACSDGVATAGSMIAQGCVSEGLFYRALADHLGVSFIADWPHLAAPLDHVAALRRGCVRLAGPGRVKWLLAPTDDALRLLIAAKERRPDIVLPSIAITTPSHLAAIIGHRMQARIAYAASHALPDQAPHLSAKDALDLRAKVVASLVAVVLLIGIFAGSRIVADLLGMIFLSGIVFRLLVCAAGLAQHQGARAGLSNGDAPFYSVLIPLRNEANMVPGLVAALKRLEYPRSKLEILFLVEADDEATHDALTVARLPPFFRIIVVPPGAPRTKPRALNAGLFLARGSLVTVYDAEDRPDPDQLRRAAERFARSPEVLAGLQARLGIDNRANSLLPRGIMEHPPQAFDSLAA